MRRSPPFYAYWGRGVTREWSYYRGERVAGSGRYHIELLGGDPGAQWTTDTDEHDEAIILHEFGHFVMDVLTSDSSHGGTHPGGVLLDPGLAWEEGRATYFACAVLRDSRYLDTIGVEPRGELRVAHDLEQINAGEVRGVGSEIGVSEVLWDLADGPRASGPSAADEDLRTWTLPDVDGDAVSIGAGEVFRAMRELAQQDGAFPDLSTFLRFLVTSGRVPELALKSMLHTGGHPADVLPEDDTPRWPLDIALGASAGGKIDSVSNPAPSGGPPRVGNGRDAVHAYRVHVPQRGVLSIRLRIFGDGQPASQSDIDLELRTLRADQIAASQGTGPAEAIDSFVDAGWYVIYVRDGGTPTRAGYELSVDARAAGAP